MTQPNKKNQIEELLKLLKIQYKSFDIYHQAFTHSSYCARQEQKSNQRLEFLGDSVLSICISEYVYHNFPDLPEGKLTKIRSFIVSEKSLAAFARAIHLETCLLLGQGEENTGGRTRDANLADAFEAFLGAIFLDKGVEEVKNFLIPLFKPEIERVRREDFISDYKTEVQYLIQKKYKNCPEYIIVREEGPPHDRHFYSQIVINGVPLLTGEGNSKKRAEEDAAKKLWLKIKNNEVEI